MKCCEQCKGGVDGFGGERCFVEAAGEYVGDGAEGGFDAGDLGGILADEGAVLVK